MSTPGKDNESAEQRRKLDKENKKSSAKGNKPVASAKGGGSDEPQMRSVNEPQIVNPLVPQVDNTIHRIQDNEQMAMNLKDSDVLAQQMGVTPQAQAVVQNIPELKNTAVPDYALSKQQESAQDTLPFEKYEYTSFDRAKAVEQAKSDSQLQAILNMAREQTKAAEEKSKKASKYAKASAWGNFFGALGQLAGLGKNTYVKPESRYLQSALAKADEARALYDKMKADNDRYILAAENAYVDKLEAQHNAKEKMKADAVKEYNKILQKDKAKQGELKLSEEKNQIQKDYNEGRITLQEKEIALKQAKNKAEAMKEDARKYPLTFTDAGTNTMYKLSNGNIKQIAAIMRDSGELSKGAMLEINKMLSSDADLDFTKESNLEIMVQDFIRKNMYTNPELKSLLSTVQRESVVSKELPKQKPIISGYTPKNL